MQRRLLFKGMSKVNAPSLTARQLRRDRGLTHRRGCAKLEQVRQDFRHGKPLYALNQTGLSFGSHLPRRGKRCGQIQVLESRPPELRSDLDPRMPAALPRIEPNLLLGVNTD